MAATDRLQEIKDNSANERDEAMRATKLMDRFRVARDARIADGIEDIWTECESLYFQETSTVKEGSWKSTAFVPHATREVHVAVPHLTAAVVDNDRPVSVKPVKPEDAELARLDERIIHYQLTNKMDFPMEWEQTATDVAVYGTAVGFVGFKRFTETRTIETVNEDGTKVVNEKVVDVDACNTYKSLNLSDVWVDPVSTPNRIPRVYFYERKSLRQIKQLKHVKNLDKLPKEPPSALEFFTRNIGQNVQQKVGIQNENLDQDSLDEEDKLHHCMWEWDFEKRTYSLVVDEMWEVIEERPFPYKHGESPFVFFFYKLRPGKKFYGIGVVEPIAKQNRQANKLRRQRDDNVELSMNRPFVIREGMLTNEKKECVYRPGQHIHTRGSIDSSIKQLEVANVTQNAYTDEQIIKRDIDQVNGLHAIIEGAGPSSDTATGSAINQKNSILRLKDPIRKMMMGFQKIVQLMRSNNNQYLSVIEKKDLLGVSGQLYNLYKATYEGREVELSVHPAKMYDNEDLKNQQLLNAVNITAQMGLAQVVDMSELVKAILKRIGGLDDTDPIFGKKQNPFTSTDFMHAMAEIRLLRAGQAVSPIPGDNHEVHIQMLEEAAAIAPNMAPVYLEQAEIHKEMLRQEAAQAQMGQAAQPQAGGAPLNPARQVSPTSGTGLIQSTMNQMGAGNGGMRNMERGQALA